MFNPITNFNNKMYYLFNINVFYHIASVPFKKKSHLDVL